MTAYDDRYVVWSAGERGTKEATAAEYIAWYRTRNPEATVALYRHDGTYVVLPPIIDVKKLGGTSV